MSDSTATRRILHLVTAGLSATRLDELHKSAAQSADTQMEIVTLTETNAAQVLPQIFAADAVAVWGGLLEEK